MAGAPVNMCAELRVPSGLGPLSRWRHGACRDWGWRAAGRPVAELAQFITAVRKVLFTKPLPRRDLGCGSGDEWESFVVAEGATVEALQVPWPSSHHGRATAAGLWGGATQGQQGCREEPAGSQGGAGGAVAGVMAAPTGRRPRGCGRRGWGEFGDGK